MSPAVQMLVAANASRAVGAARAINRDWLREYIAIVEEQRARASSPEFARLNAQIILEAELLLQFANAIAERGLPEEEFKRLTETCARQVLEREGKR